MKKLLFIILAIAASSTVFAQISEGGMPRSFHTAALKSKAVIATYTLPALDTVSLLKYDNKTTTPFRYGVVKNVSIDLKNAGTKVSLPDGGTLWRYKISSASDKSIALFFSTFILPDGAELYLYNEDYTVVRGAYTNLNMRDDMGFAIGDFPGNYVIAEYYEPANPKFEGSLIINGISEAYIDILGAKSKSTDVNGYIGVNCEEGKEWQEQKHAVLKYSFISGSYSYLCSGALINNTKNNGVPYFLTANHCISSASVAPSVIAYFNYENPACVDVSSYTPQTISGATLITTGSESDYTLLLFDTTKVSRIPTSYKPYFAGWDISGNIAQNTVGIHHPHGYKKKISVDNDPCKSYEFSISWEGGSVTPAGSHWQVIFDEGITASGSSGSPLFDQNHRIIGQLHGGDAINSYYGKLSYSVYHPSSTFDNLKKYLDPVYSFVTTLNGYYPPQNSPDPQFLSDFSSVCTGSPVTISGYSAFAPTSWKWSFSPATISYANGTDETSQNPSVSFNASGAYTVSLETGNSAGKETLTLGNIISAGTTLSIKVYPTGLKDSCLNDFTGISLEAYGADAYLWTLADESSNYFYIEDNTTNPAVVKLKAGADISSDKTLSLTVLGTQGSCQNSAIYSIPFTAQSNDNIANAINLTVGKNGIFSNKCATVETGEPAPGAISCTSQLSWCDETLTGVASLDNTVWFCYTPDYDQTTMIYSTGMDNQIAVYKAATYSDVLNGNFQLIGANDDYSVSDFNPKLTSLSLKGKQPYWIQVDGSAGGAIGSFYLYVTVLSGVNDVTGTDAEIKVYPVPACDYVNLESEAFLGVKLVSVDLYNPAGAKLYSETYTEGESKIQLPLSGLPSGIYLADIRYNGKRSTVKIVK